MGIRIGHADLCWPLLDFITTQITKGADNATVCWGFDLTGFIVEDYSFLLSVEDYQLRRPPFAIVRPVNLKPLPLQRLPVHLCMHSQ